MRLRIFECKLLGAATAKLSYVGIVAIAGNCLSGFHSPLRWLKQPGASPPANNSSGS